MGHLKIVISTIKPNQFVSKGGFLEYLYRGSPLSMYHFWDLEKIVLCNAKFILVE